LFIQWAPLDASSSLRVHALESTAVGAAQLAAEAAVGVVSLAIIDADPERVRLRTLA